MFVKLFTQILDSSLADNRRLRHFFTDLLLCADVKGYIIMTESAIARRIGASMEEVTWGIGELLKPDPRSKSQEANGARIEALEGQGYGWRVVNYEHYRTLRDANQLREATKERVRRHRERNPVTPCNAHVTPCNADVTLVTHGNAITEAEAEAEADSETQKDASAPFSSPEFKTAWREWEQHRREIRKKLTPTTRKRQLEQLGAMSEADAIQSIRQSVANGWTGLFEPKGKASSKNNHAGIQENIPF